MKTNRRDKHGGFRSQRGQPRHRRGQLLVELLLAVVILAAGLTVVIRSFLMSLRAASDTAGYTGAVIAADNLFVQTLQLYPEETAAAKETSKDYRTQVRLAQPSELSAGLVPAEIGVSWDEGRKKISTTTYIYRP